MSLMQHLKEKSLLVKCAAVIVLLVFAACAVNPVTGKKEFMLLSESDEIQMGKNVYPSAIWGAEGGGGEYKDEQLRSYLNGVVGKIHQNSHRPHLPYSFAIQNSTVPNAWAIPGYVVITRGLLTGLDNEAEFAFVMGHEMGHVSARHSARQMSYTILQQVALTAAGLALQGEEYGDLVVGLGAIGSSLMLLKFSRDDELEADGLGVLYMTKLGYDPRYAITAHRNLEKISNEYVRSLGQEPHEKNAFEELLSTHPRTQIRIEEIQQIINTTPRTPVIGDGASRERFQQMVAGLKKTNKLYAEHYDKAVREFQNNNLAAVERHLNYAITANRYQAPFYALEGFVQLRRKNYAEAERYLNGALTLEKNYQPAIRGMGIVNYRKQMYSESIRLLKLSTAIFPDDPSSLYFLGMSYYKTGDFRSAIPPLNKFSGARPKHPSVNGVLGTCYEKTNDRTSAYNAYAKQAQIKQDNEMGRYAVDRLNALKPYIEEQKKLKK